MPTTARILIVDDEKSHRDLLRDILADGDYLVTEASNGNEALQRFAEESFDSVVLDIRMPGMSGFEVCREMRKTQPLLPIIMVTGFGGHDDLVTAMKSGATEFVRKPYPPQELLARVNAMVNTKRLTDQLESVESMLFALARIVETRDEDTGDHCSRVAQVASAFGAELGLGEEAVNHLRLGSVLHDIGKLAIPDRVLLKPGPLDESEWTIMRQHTVIGEALCRDLKSLRGILPIIRHHHERWNGSGYPDGLAAENIPLLARVFQFADVLDALANRRPYKEPWSLPAIIEEFRRGAASGHYDPQLSERFIALLERRPELLTADLPAAESDRGLQLYRSIAANLSSKAA